MYPGVDLVYYGNQQQLEYDFIVAPTVNPNEIELQFPGAVLNLTSDGDLIVRTEGEDVIFRQARCISVDHQQEADRAGAIQAALQNSVGFSIGNYDKAKPLIIDPSLAYSTFLRGAGDNRAYAIAVDPLGEAYITGETGSQTFPVTGGSFQPTAQPGGDAFVDQNKCVRIGFGLLHLPGRQRNLRLGNCRGFGRECLRRPLYPVQSTFPGHARSISNAPQAPAPTERPS